MTLRYMFQSIKKHFKYNFLFYFILCIIFIMGSIVGPLIVKKINPNNQITILKLSHPYFKNIYLGEYDGLSILKTSFVNNLLIVVLISILGLINIGTFFVPIIIFIKGTFTGFSVAFLVHRFGIRGFLASFLGLYPQSIFIIIGFIGVGAISMTMSSSLRTVLKPNNIRRQDLSIRKYISLLSIFIVIVIIGGLIEGILSPIIMKLIIKDFI